MRFFFVLLGVICVILGSIGVIVPGLPTTPFLLLASWCFYKGSPRLKAWLLNSFLGKYIRDYEKNRGLTIKKKIYIILLMSTMIFISTYFFIATLVVRLIVVGAGAIGCIVVGFVVPTIKKEYPSDDGK